MARYAYDDTAAPVRARARSGGGWSQLFWFAVAAAAVGFAGYVFLVPYQKMMSSLNARTAELGEARATVESAITERERMKGEITRLQSLAKDREAADAKKRGGADAIGTALRTSLEELGATVAVNGGRVLVSFSADKFIDANGIDVSENGQTALKILAGALKKNGASARVKAQFSAALPPKELRSLFRTVGEMSAVRAARVISALNDDGVAPERLMTYGETEKSAPAVTRAKKGAAPPPPAEHVDIEVDPE